MIFVELTPFVVFRESHWTDDELWALQRALLIKPDTGAVIPGAGGLRKLRWSAQRRGKRGGARVIYYWYVAADRIYLISAYAKSRRDDVTVRQLKQLRRLLKESIDG